MHEGVVLVLIVALFALAALLFGLFTVLWGIVAGAWRAVARFFVGSDRTGRSVPRRRGKPLICQDERCRKVEYREATFCSQCGRRLDRPGAGREHYA